MTGASGLATDWTYTYDRNGNRRTRSDGTTTLTYTYDRTDQLRTIGNGVLADAAFSYNPYGDLTSKVERATGGAWQTSAYAYDLAGRLTSIDGPAAGSGDAATFTFDALGRFRTRALAGSTDTYTYAGTTETVVRIANSVAGTTDSLVDSAGDRLAVTAGSTLNWFLPDPHGNVAAALSADQATVVNALRYDPWGELVDDGGAGGSAVGAQHWKFQGRLDVAPAGTDAGALYDLGARFYAPSLGVFTQLDSVMGSAQDPRSMNRFLYAHANPATLIDPSGHAACMRFIDGRVRATTRRSSTGPGQGPMWCVVGSLDIRVEEQPTPSRSGRPRSQPCLPPASPLRRSQLRPHETALLPRRLTPTGADRTRSLH